MGSLAFYSIAFHSTASHRVISHRVTSHRITRYGVLSRVIACYRKASVDVLVECSVLQMIGLVVRGLHILQ